MKLSTKRTLFKVAAILLFIGFAVSILVLIGLTFAFDPIAEQYVIMLEQYMGYDIASMVDDVDLYLTVVKIVAIVANWISAMFLVGIGALYMKRANMNQEQLEQKRTSTIAWSVFTILFISLVPGILGLVAILSGRSEEEKLEAAKEAEPEIVAEEPTSEVAKRIAELKKLKASGALSDAEYEKLLGEIIK